jgi:Lon protease-like protein
VNPSPAAPAPAAPSPPDYGALPLFPLELVLYPGSVLPLRIFELRYLDMVGRCHREGRPFGIVALTAGREVAQPAGPQEGGFAPEAFHFTGTLARIEQLSNPQPGLLEIWCRGEGRFRLHTVRRERNGLWVGMGEPLPQDPPMAVPSDLETLAYSLKAVLDRIDSEVRKQDATAESPPHHLDDCGWVANRWAELLPLELEAKQRLLEIDSPLLRLELAADWLDRLQREAKRSGS